LALLKILALGNQQIAQGRVKPLAEVANRGRALTGAKHDSPKAAQHVLTRILGETVAIYVITDGRRDMQSLL
jgi:hypothetical protein